MAFNSVKRALEDDVYAHMFLVHSDGSSCPDGCDSAADPKRLAAYEKASDEAYWDKWGDDARNA